MLSEQNRESVISLCFLGPLWQIWGISSVCGVAVWQGVRYLNRHAIHWQHHRKAPTPSEADCVPGRNRTASAAGGEAILFAAFGRTDSFGGSDQDQGYRRGAERV